MRRLFVPILAVSFLCCVTSAAKAADREAIREEVVQILSQLVQPLTTRPDDGRAWFLDADGSILNKKGHIRLTWDGESHHGIDIHIKGLATFSMGFGETESWLYLPEFNKIFTSQHEPLEDASLLTDCRVWTLMKTQAGALATLVMFADIPDNLVLEKKEDGTIRIDNSKDVRLEIRRDEDGSIHLKSLSDKYPVQIDFNNWEQVPIQQIEAMLEPPTALKSEKVDIEDLRWMFRTAADFGAESLLRRVNPKSVPDPMKGIQQEQGVAVVKFSGSPEDMGSQHGTLLKEAIHYNTHHTLHGVGLVSTIQTGVWLPNELKETWKKQLKYIPERYVREVDAMAKAADLPLDWAHEATIYPERFHCSGFTLRGKATVGGRLYHGRILDYMTVGGLQNTATIMVFDPEDRNAWVNIGYAGQCSTVSAMNEKGLAMGEMGGAGNGYVDGFPMTLLMREIMERFETTEEALNWMKSVPRTCEYFYCLSDAKTKQMAGVASYAKKLAQERGIEDLQIIRPGMFHPLLNHPIEDTVLMSAGQRYENLVKRVRRDYGKIDMKKAWELMRGGVAMKSNLHTALFAPETLDFWAAQAGPLGEPAYTQPVAKFNLKKLLQPMEVTRTSDAGVLAR